jgi:putative Ca2+/H+ antiporter (TMEM165/GDT1 family)
MLINLHLYPRLVASQISVFFGALAAHAAATAGAVAGGAILSEFISEKFIGYIGGCLFIVFAVTTAVGLF